MSNPDRAVRPRGEALCRLIDEVRREFFARGSRHSDPTEDGSVRSVSIEVHDRLSIDAQLAVMADLVRYEAEIVLVRDAEDVFAASDTPRAYLADLTCEIVYQELMSDPVVMMEDESRAALPD
jgi:hypothetical protein